MFLSVSVYSYFFCFNALLRNRMRFNSDEYDNFLGDMVVANGGKFADLIRNQEV